MSPHSGTKGEGQPLSRTGHAVLLVGVEAQDRGERTSGAHLSYRPGRARSISQAPRTGKGSAPAAGQCGEVRREPVRVTAPIPGLYDFIHIDLTIRIQTRNIL